jgi:hypothetical protein
VFLDIVISFQEKTQGIKAKSFFWLTTSAMVGFHPALNPLVIPLLIPQIYLSFKSVIGCNRVCI